MIGATHSALSAVKAFQKKMNVTANNIANVDSDEFKKSRVLMEEGAHGGVTARVEQVNTPGVPKESIRDDQIVEVESSNVDLAEELTEMIPTKSAYSANLTTLKTHESMIGSLLDILG